LLANIDLVSSGALGCNCLPIEVCNDDSPDSVYLEYEARCTGKCKFYKNAIDKSKRFEWVIVGCESGPKRRPCPIEWIENIVKQCQDAGVSVFVKQIEINGKVSHDMAEWPPALRVRQLPEGLGQ